MDGNRLDLRDPDLWNEVPSSEMWRRYREDYLVPRLAATFAPDRPHAVANPSREVRMPADAAA